MIKKIEIPNAFDHLTESERLYLNISNNIWNQRVFRGFTIMQMAELLDISERHFALIESGKRHPSLVLLSRMWKILGISPDYLLLENHALDNVYTREEFERVQKIYAVTTLINNLPNYDLDIILGLIRALWAEKSK